MTRSGKGITGQFSLAAVDHCAQYRHGRVAVAFVRKGLAKSVQVYSPLAACKHGADGLPYELPALFRAIGASLTDETFALPAPEAGSETE